jgi:hypothetical protein
VRSNNCCRLIFNTRTAVSDGALCVTHIVSGTTGLTVNISTYTDIMKLKLLGQRFPNFFQVGTTFISQNVLRNPLLLSPLKANCLRFSTTVCDTKFTLILCFLSFFGLMSNLRGPQGQNPRTTCGPRTKVWETLLYRNWFLEKRENIKSKKLSHWRKNGSNTKNFGKITG